VAFWDLAGDRQDGGPISWLAIWQYFQVEGFGDFHTFQRIIKNMDSFYIKAVNEKTK